MILDPKLKDYATPRQSEVIDAVNETGSMEKAAAKLGVVKNTIFEAVQGARKKAARAGHAPGHFESGVAPGYLMGKVTVQRGPGGVERVWERQSPEAANTEAFLARCEERLNNFPRFMAVNPPPIRSAPLTNFLGLFDLHIGEKISSDDPAGRWDIAIAKRTIIDSVSHAISVAPKAKRLVLCFGGDAMHYDGVTPVTPTSKHVLHSDGDFDDMVDATLDVAVGAIDIALTNYEEVHLIWATGNHDLSTSRMLRKMFARLYADEPRLHVLQSRLDFYALRFGKVMIGVHHGHGSKLTDLAGKFAAMFREMWGQAVYAYAHAGHYHHYHGKEGNGMIATQHPALPPSDDYALGKGLISRRGCLMVTYHDDFGEVASATMRPEMLG